MNSLQYRVYLTPLVAAGAYGDEVEVSDYVKAQNGSITKSIDSTDFSVALYTFNDVTLACDNSNGKFSDPSDSRSLFRVTRDLARIRIVFDNTGGVSPPVVYNGLIQDEATVIDVETDELTFTILGMDSVLRKSLIPIYTVTSGMTAKQAMIAILNTADVKAVLGVSTANINPANDITVDFGDKFDGVTKSQALMELLGASNSVMVIDASFNVIVKSRLETTLNPVTYLYGRGNSYGKENIKALSNYNTGLHRVINSVQISTGNDPDNNPIEVHDDTSIATYGLRQKQFNFQWLDGVENLDNVLSIAAALLEEFKYPKIECQVRVFSTLVPGVDLLDLASVDFPFVIAPAGLRLPIIGITKIGDVNSPLPYIRGALKIEANVAFKVIERQDDISALTTTLKLRQIGTDAADGYF